MLLTSSSASRSLLPLATCQALATSSVRLCHRPQPSRHVSLSSSADPFLRSLIRPRVARLHVLPPVASPLAMATVRTPPKEGQESVWDYPRPPRLEKTQKNIKIQFNGELIADTSEAFRVLETSHPPVYYIPQKDIKMQYMRKVPGSSFCEWKGSATYWSLTVGNRSADKVAWSYENPSTPFIPITSHIAFYCAPMDFCTVGGEKVQPQPGGFYGGWITSDIVGPFKGGPGSWGW